MARLILFDIDGTLTESNDVDTHCYAHVMSEFLGVPIDTCWSNYRNVTDSGIAAELFERHGRSLDELSVVRERFVAMIERELNAAPHQCAEKPGAGAMLERLRRMPEFGTGLATGSWSGSARAKLRCAGIDVDGLPIASADDALARADIMTICRDRVLAGARGVPASETIYVGDGMWDAEASRAVRWRFIGIGEGERGRQLADPGGAAHVFPDFRDADAFLAAVRAI